ncbi:MAG: glutathione peroxidase [bacterium]
MADSIYKFAAANLQGKVVKFDSFKGKVVLMVNTASKCGFTPQYAGLEHLYKKYKDKGLVILGFPCNQFANQEPLENNKIAENCLINYGVTFPMFSKVYVNGNNTHPIYKYLKSQKPGLLGQSIKWHFTKFLINKSGIPIKRFAPITKPSAIEKYILQLL